MTRVLPALMDRRMIHAETGLPLASCESLMRACELVRPEGVRRVYVRREELYRKLNTRRDSVA